MLSRCLFTHASFASTFWLVSSSCTFRFCYTFSISSEYIFIFRFSIFACSLSFLIFDSNLICHSGFDFLSVVFRVTLIFSQAILLWHRLNCLIPFFFLLWFLSICRLHSRFRTWLSSSLGSWKKAVLFSFRTWFFSRFLHPFLLLESMWASLCLRYFCHYHLASGGDLLVFLYLVSL